MPMIKKSNPSRAIKPADSAQSRFMAEVKLESSSCCSNDEALIVEGIEEGVIFPFGSQKTREIL
jgi:hypothetical protein